MILTAGALDDREELALGAGVGAAPPRTMLTELIPGGPCRLLLGFMLRPVENQSCFLLGSLTITQKNLEKNFRQSNQPEASPLQ